MALIPYFLPKSSEVMLTVLLNEKDKYTETVKRVYLPVSEANNSDDIRGLLEYIEDTKVHVKEKDLVVENFNTTHFTEYTTPTISLDLVPLKINRLFLIQDCTSEVPAFASSSYFRSSTFMSASLQGVRLAKSKLIHQFHPIVGKYLPATLSVIRTGRGTFEVLM